MDLKVIGPDPLPPDGHGCIKVGAATLFPRHNVLVTDPSGLHCLQRAAFLERLHQIRHAQRRPLLTDRERDEELGETLDLFVRDGDIHIRPDPNRLDLMMAGDTILCGRYPKHRIRFLALERPEVRQKLRERGQLWRICRPPKTPEESIRLIEHSRCAIGRSAVYCSNAYTGTRFVTLGSLAGLANLAVGDLRAQLAEIADYAQRRNRQGNPEVALFAVEPAAARELLQRYSWRDLSDTDLWRAHAELEEAVRALTPQNLRRDDPRLQSWRSAMVEALIEGSDATGRTRLVENLGPEFHLRVRWLPGARFDRGECLPDSVFDEVGKPNARPDQRDACDPRVLELIHNLLRDFGELAYVNVGRILTDEHRPAAKVGRREVYVAEVKPAGQAPTSILVLRLLRWGTRERLDNKQTMRRAVCDSLEYISYVLDRRLGCRQLGMNVSSKVSLHFLNETYVGENQGERGAKTWAAYLVRDYVAGQGANQVSDAKLADPAYALALAGLLGRAAAPNLIVGRIDRQTEEAVFDCGDEVVVEDAGGLPCEIVVCDHGGSFGSYRRGLITFAKGYARPMNARLAWVPEPARFKATYLEALRARFTEIRADYLSRRGAFRDLFRHLSPDPEGNFAYRWLKVLDRLEASNIDEIVEAIREQIA